MFVLGLVIGAAIMGAAWWIDRRSVKGIKTDLENARATIKSLSDQIKRAK